MAAGSPAALAGRMESELHAAARSLVRAGAGRIFPGLFWRLQAPLRGVALTFDDGPDPELTPRLLDVLAEHGARATFFVVGEAARRHPVLVRRILAEGHTLGNHTETHARCPTLTPEVFRRELKSVDLLLESITTTAAPRAFRPPYGAITPAQLRSLRGRRVALWTRDSRDYREASAQDIGALGERLEPRDVVLFHDRFPATLAGLPSLLRSLRGRGLEAVGLDDPRLYPPARGEDRLLLKVLSLQYRRFRRGAK